MASGGVAGRQPDGLRIDLMAEREKGGQAVIAAVASAVSGQIACQGIVRQLRLETLGGYDIGRVVIEGDWV